MAKLKSLRYPKKPKASASVATMENYLRRVSEVDKENRQRQAQNKKAEALRKRISGIGKAGTSKKSSRKHR